MIKLEILDHYGQRVNYDDTSTAQISVPPGTTLEGSLKQTSSKGIIEYKDIVVTKAPNINVLLELDVIIASMQEKYSYSIKQQVDLYL